MGFQAEWFTVMVSYWDLRSATLKYSSQDKLFNSILLKIFMFMIIIIMTTLKQGVPQIVQLDLSKENFIAGMFWFPALITNFLIVHLSFLCTK